MPTATARGVTISLGVDTRWASRAVSGGVTDMGEPFGPAQCERLAVGHRERPVKEKGIAG
ncbi:MAG: hypothetical protein F4Z29_12240 [Gemmatimonadetes bacterium]|nr:hypothetical protein [Gemmatimonadota bacterium]